MALVASGSCSGGGSEEALHPLVVCAPICSNQGPPGTVAAAAAQLELQEATNLNAALNLELLNLQVPVTHLRAS